MANLTYRQSIQEAPSSTTTKNAALTSQEIDGNFKSLNDELITKAPLVSPGLSGVPTAPTATAGTNTTQLATTAFVQTGLSSRQPLDATLTALAGVTTAANQLIYATGSDAFATTSLTSFGRSLIDDADAATARTTLGLGTAAVQSDDRYAHRSNNLSDLANIAAARSNLGLGNVDNTSDVNKSVASAAQLTTARSINGTNFNGTGNITTNSWGTARTLTIGNTGKSVNGSADVSWSLNEIGVTAATESNAGIVALATAAEAQALASATLALTPARLADAFKGANQSLSRNGYQKLPGGLIIQWGFRTVSGATSVNADVTFPIAFPNAALAMIASIGVDISDYDHNNDTGLRACVQSVSYGRPTNTSCDGQATLNNYVNYGRVIQWLAIGY